MHCRLSAIGATVLVAGTVAVGALPAGASAAGTSPQDKNWLTASMQGDRFEIIGGQMAMTHSTNARIQNLGKRLKIDHTASLKRAAAAAHSRDVDVPREPSPSEQWELDTLNALQGAAFDRAYTSLEGKDHQQDISEAVEESKGGSDSYVVHLARKAIGMYHRHLHLSEAAFKSLG